MGAESSDEQPREPTDEEPPSKWVRAVDRFMWGVRPPTSKAERSRRWKGVRRDLWSFAKWWLR